MGLYIDDDVGLAIKAMSAKLGLPGGLAAMGVGEEQFEAIISGAMADHCHKTGPRIATLDDYRAMSIASM
jgi:alcohol dehydrogenase class IV